RREHRRSGRGGRGAAPRRRRAARSRPVHRRPQVVKAFVQTAIGQFEECDLPRPEPGPGEVALRMRAALTCGTDVKLLARGHARIALPVTMGHELCGEVAAAGRGADGFRTGERVVPGISGPCGGCADCVAGRPNLCERGHTDRTWGAFAEYVRV